MKHDRINKNPFNDSIEIMSNNFRQDFHIAADIPGKFVEISNKDVYVNGRKIGEMDISYIIDPDGNTIKVRMVLNLEHQSTPVDEPKLEQMGNYAVQQISDHNIPQVTVVLTHIDKEKHSQKHEISPSLKLEPIYIVYDEAEIEKRLNRVKTKINNNEHLNNVDALNLGIISVFAPRYKALEIVEEVVELYKKVSKQLEQQMELTLYDVLFQMIDAYSKEEEDYQRLKKMLDNHTNEKTKEESRAMRYLREKYNYVLEEKNSILEEKNSILEEKNSLKEKYDAVLANNSSVLEEKNSVLEENSSLKEKIKILEEKLNSQNHGPLNGK